MKLNNKKTDVRSRPRQINGTMIRSRSKTEYVAFNEEVIGVQGWESRNGHHYPYNLAPSVCDALIIHEDSQLKTHLIPFSCS